MFAEKTKKGFGFIINRTFYLGVYEAIEYG